MAAPTVSVLMPVYNCERYIDEAAQSVRDQTFSDFEFIIIDDGSTDATASRVRQHEKLDRRIRVSSRPNKGIAETLNEALSLARGKYIARMDGDDISLPNRFERQVNYLDQHPECVAVGARVLLVDVDGAPLRCVGDRQTHEEIDAAHMRGEGAALVHGVGMFRTDALGAIGGYALRLDEDLDLCLRLAEHGRLANLPEVLLQWRQHPRSVGHRYYRELVRSIRVAVSEARHRRGLPPLQDSEPLVLEVAEGSGDVDEAQYHQKWAWWALQSGYRWTARKHALVALRKDPLSLDSWRLGFCALRGR